MLDPSDFNCVDWNHTCSRGVGNSDPGGPLSCRICCYPYLNTPICNFLLILKILVRLV